MFRFFHSRRSLAFHSPEKRTRCTERQPAGDEGDYGVTPPSYPGQIGITALQGPVLKPGQDGADGQAG